MSVPGICGWIHTNTKEFYLGKPYIICFSSNSYGYIDYFLFLKIHYMFSFEMQSIGTSFHWPVDFFNHNSLAVPCPPGAHCFRYWQYATFSRTDRAVLLATVKRCIGPYSIYAEVWIFLYLFLSRLCKIYCAKYMVSHKFCKNIHLPLWPTASGT
jgi:hypothetical protein